VIEAQGLTKHYGSTVAVDHVSFTVRPGMVTGFLGPNGAGKSTTMRMVVGLDRPTAGSVTIDGKPYAAHRDPLHQVGILLEAKAIHTSRSARNHLLALAATHGIPTRRVDEVLELVGLTAVARRRAGGFSLGMGQRLGIASALLGDPAVLVLDEPVNGLDPEGVLWVRHLLKSLAAEGRTVFVSSHLMNEMAVTADHLIVLGRGKLLADAPTDEIIGQASVALVRVRTAEADRLTRALEGPGVGVQVPDPGHPDVLEITGLPSERIGQVALDERILLSELTPVRASLEDAFMEMTAGAVEFHGGAPAASSGTPVADGSPT
jgi:ABC-2 type transport system ATP-binding protein